MLLVLLAICTLKLVSAADENYCEPGFCDETSDDACGLEFAQECGEDAEIVPLKEERKIILDLHNHHRGRLASGRMPGYAPAVRMPTLKWSDDLAYLAE